MTTLLEYSVAQTDRINNFPKNICVGQMNGQMNGQIVVYLIELEFTWVWVDNKVQF